MTKVRRKSHAPITIALIRSKCEECGKCWIWQGALSNNQPYMSAAGKTFGVRRWIAKSKRLNLSGGRLASVSCMTAKCVNPAHVVTMTRTELQNLYHDRLQYTKWPSRNAKLSAVARARARHTEETVQKVRELSETMSQRAVARALGVHFDFVNKVVRGKAWRDYTANPMGHMAEVLKGLAQ